MAGPRSRGKTLFIRLHCHNNKVQWKNFRVFLKFLDTTIGYCLFSFVYLFVYLFSFSINKFLFTTVNKQFL